MSNRTAFSDGWKKALLRRPPASGAIVVGDAVKS
jgi:hypothetical protein